MPSKTNNKKGGTFKNANKYLTEEQAKFVYKKVNAGKAIDTSVIKQKMEQEKLVGTEIENTYQKAILSDVGKKGKDPAQIEDW